MRTADATHDPARRSWITSANDPATDFPIQNLPFGVFARDAQIYLLALRGETISPEVHARAAEAFTTYAGGLERALGSNRRFLVGDDVSLADICFACELSLFFNERARSGALVKQGLKPEYTIADAGQGLRAGQKAVDDEARDHAPNRRPIASGKAGR